MLGFLSVRDEWNRKKDPAPKNVRNFDRIQIIFRHRKTRIFVRPDHLSHRLGQSALDGNRKRGHHFRSAGRTHQFREDLLRREVS